MAVMLIGRGVRDVTMTSLLYPGNSIMQLSSKATSAFAVCGPATGGLKIHPYTVRRSCSTK